MIQPNCKRDFLDYLQKKMDTQEKLKLSPNYECVLQVFGFNFV